MPKDTPFSVADANNATLPSAPHVRQQPQRRAQERRATLKRVAAIDLGSNSFHLLVANCRQGRLQIVARRGEKVQLASGLGDDGQLDDAAIQRALSCLGRFSAFLRNIAPENLRIVGTNALREADNSRAFIDQAEAQLGYPIEIIAGREEARLIYLGAAHALAEHGRRLIVDIGGGSTELIIGEASEPLALESLRMGCVTFSRRFFADGKITPANMRRAELAALSELVHIQRAYQQLGWDELVGTSGTAKAVASVLYAYGDTPQQGIITRTGLDKLRKRLLDCKRLDKVALDGLKADRASILPAGVAVLTAIFEAFSLERMRFAEGALREGVLYDMVGRDHAADSRGKSIETLKYRYSVDQRQAHNVATTAGQLFDLARQSWSLGDEQRRYLCWAAELYELGLAVSHSRFHRHGAYLIEHSDMAGFSRPEQQLLAFLVRAHRRKFPQKECLMLPRARQQDAARLARLLRLAVLFNHSRPEQAPADLPVSIVDEVIEVALSPGDRDSLLGADLEQEAAYLNAAGYSLSLT